MTKLILIRGLPGSGKSTEAARLLSIGLADWHEEADRYLHDDQGVYRFDPSKLHYAHSQCFSNTTKFLKSGYSVVVSNTFTRWREMADYIDYATGNKIDLIVCEQTNQYGSIHGVPPEKIEQMKARFIDASGFLSRFEEKYGFRFNGQYWKN